MQKRFIKSRRSARRGSRPVCRRPRIERLERRELLATVTLSSSWRADDFTANGNFSYLYSQSNPNYTDRIPNGSVQLTSGHIEFTGPVHGTWQVGARVEGNGNETVNGQQCSAYRAIHVGTMGGDYVDGILKGTDSSPTSSSYPSYSGPCSQPDNPTDYSPFNSALATLLTGTYDETKKLAGFTWNGPYADGTIAVTIPPTAIQYKNSAPTDLVVLAKSTDAGLEITAKVVGQHLTPGNGGRAAAVTDVQLFYTSAANAQSIVGNVALNKPINVFWNTLQIDATVTDFDNIPQTARYIMVQIDRANTVAEEPSNNIQFVPLNDIQLVSFNGGDLAHNRAAHQLALTYRIERPTNDPKDDKPFEVQIVGASSANSSGLQSVLHTFIVSPDAITNSGGALSLQGEPSSNALRSGLHTLIIHTSALGLADQFADHDHKFIVAVADRDDLIFEVDNQPLDEDNLATFAGYIQDVPDGTAVLRTGSNSKDEVVVTQANSVHVDWKGNAKINFTSPSSLVVIASGGDDSVTADESSQPVSAPLHLYGDSGNDTLVGGSGPDRLEGGPGDDVLIGGHDSDELFGGPGSGSDVLIGDGFQLNGLSLENLTDAFTNYLSTKTLDFEFQLVPSGGARDTIEAGDGDALIIGGTGGDSIRGGGGLSLIFAGSFQTKKASASFNTTDAKSNFTAAIKVLSTLIDGIEIVDSGQNEIIGGTGPNLIIGGPTPDIITGGDGPLDILIGNGSGDTIDGQNGFNLIIGGEESDVLTGGDDGNLIFGDDIVLNGLNIDVQSLLQLNLLNVLSPPEFDLRGDGDDTLYGGAGFDFLVGGDGRDTMYGGDGLNIAFGDDVRLQVGGALGVLMNFSSIASQLSRVPIGDPSAVLAAFESLYGLWEAFWDRLSGQRQDRRDTYVGGPKTDIVFGGGGDDLLAGGLGVDFMVGGFGDDFFKADPDVPAVADNLIDDFCFGGLGDDTFQGGPGSDFMASTFGADTFYGNDGNDVIVGGDGADALFGGAGNDTLVGGQGSDALVGGQGVDAFVDTGGINFAVARDAIIVTTLDDQLDGNPTELSLREAIDLANSNAGADAIIFADALTSNVVPGSPAWITLTVAELPRIQEALVILGPGAAWLGIDGAGQSTAFPSASGVSVSVRGLLLANFDLGVDFGDAPSANQSGFENSYPTLAADNGAQHTVGAWFLGARVDADIDGIPDAFAGQGSNGGDDNDGQADEDGVSLLATALAIGNAVSTSSFLVWSSLTGKLDAWIDFNRDGQFDHPGEQVNGASVDLAPGPNVVSFAMPGNMIPGDAFARLRFSATGGLGPGGAGGVGEVEDIVVRFVAQANEVAIQLPPAELGPNTLLSQGRQALLRDSQNRYWFSAPSIAAERLRITGTDANDTLRLETIVPNAQWSVDFGAGDDVAEVEALAFQRIDGGDGHDGIRLLGDGLHLDLTTLPVGALQSVESIDLDGKQSQVTLDPSAIRAHSDGTNRLEVIAPRSDTRFHIGSGWNVREGVITARGFRHELTKDGATLWIGNTRPWQNPLSQFDVSRDNAVSPFDALLLVNTLNKEFSRRLPDPVVSGSLPAFYFDVNGDGSVSPIDALFVINFLNTRTTGEGEGLSSLPDHDLSASNPLDTLEMNGAGPVPYPVWSQYSAVLDDGSHQARATSRLQATDAAGRLGIPGSDRVGTKSLESTRGHKWDHDAPGPYPTIETAADSATLSSAGGQAADWAQLAELLASERSRFEFL